MKKAHLGWKVAAVLLSIIAVGDVVAKAAKPSNSLAAIAASLGLCFAAVGVLQYSFGWPKLSGTVWRVFGPVFSVVMIWSVARDLGWLATRLAVRPLTVAEQAGTVFLFVLLASYGLVVIVPLYRLGEWRLGRADERDETLAALSNTFG